MIFKKNYVYKHKYFGKILYVVNNIKECVTMDKYECPCGYIYDPAEGDPDNGIAPGTPYEDLPEDWVCPNCGLPKSEFYKH